MSDFLGRIRAAAAIAERIEEHGGHVMLFTARSKSVGETRIVPGLGTDSDDIRRILDDSRIEHGGVRPSHVEVVVREGEKPSGATIVVRRTADQVPETDSSPSALLQIVSDLEKGGLEVNSAEFHRMHQLLIVRTESHTAVDMTDVLSGCTLRKHSVHGHGLWHGDVGGMRLEVMWVIRDGGDRRDMPVSVAQLVNVLEISGVRVAGVEWTRATRMIRITVVADTSETVDHVSEVLRDRDLVAVSDSRDARHPHKAILAYEYDEGDMLVRTISSEEYAS